MSLDEIFKEAGVPILATNDPEMYGWLANVTDPARNAGSFVLAIAGAAMRADHENYALIRQALLQLRRKYPEYDKSLSELRGSSGS